MRNLTATICLTLAVFVGGAGVTVNVWAEPRVVTLRIEEESYSLPLPDGFCDATESLYGIQTLRVLEKVYSNNPSIGKPIAIFRPCNAAEGNLFPWGFVSSFPKNKFINNQVSFNKLRRRLLEDKKFVEKFNEKSFEKNKKTLMNYGVELSKVEVGRPNIIWEDDNVSIMILINNMRVNDTPFKELTIYASTVINGRVIQIATFDEVDNFINLKTYSSDLVKNAARFKAITVTNKKTYFKEARRENKRESERAQDENDPMQQVMNYLVTGDPLSRNNGSYKAEIFNREKCIMGWKDNNGGYVKIHWNNLNYSSIRVFEFFRDGVWMNYLKVTGHPVAVEVNVKQVFLMSALIAKGFSNGSYSSAEIPVGVPEQFETSRMIKALELLYSRYCTGSKKKTAF